MEFNTKAVHVGVDKDSAYNSVTTPIYPSSTFEFEDIGVTKGYDYTRSGNPTRKALEENLAALEGGVAAWATATGMAAETAVMFLFERGDHIVAGNDIYGGTYRLFVNAFSKMGMEFSFVDMRDPENVRRALKPNTKGIWIETPSNPLLNIVDISAVVEIAREAGAMTIADNTFLSPYFQRPFEFGVDIVVHSTTKYLNGHCDVVGGAIVAREDSLAEKIGFLVNALGVGESPFDSWLVLRGVKTLGYRMEIHQRNAFAVAEFLRAHDGVEKVYYPGLKEHPQHDLAKRQMKGFGGMVSFDVRGGRDETYRFLRRLKSIPLAESLGGVGSLIEHPFTMSHASMPEEARREAGIRENTVRLSVGLEDPRDIIEDLRCALA
ncbi:MAG: trans-sulfuration enzyme family protein [bacterium]